MSAFFAILVYSTYFVNNKQSENLAVKQPLSTYSVNYTPNYRSGGSNVDFTTAAEKSLHSVVHVKNTTQVQVTLVLKIYFSEDHKIDIKLEQDLE